MSCFRTLKPIHASMTTDAGSRHRSATAWASIGLAGILSLPATLSAATCVFQEDFESYPIGTMPTGTWTKEDYRNMPQVVATALDGGVGPHAGGKMLRANWDGTVAWNDPASFECMMLPSWSMNRETLIRFWVRVDADVDATAGSKLYRLGRSICSFGDIQFEQGANPTLFLYFGTENAQIGSSFWGGGPGMRGGTWHKIEIYLLTSQDANADGAIKVWADGVQVWQALNVSTTSAYPWTAFYVMSNWSNNPGWEHDANNHVYWDDIEIFSDAGSGTAVTGALSDASVQRGGAPPTNHAPVAVGQDITAAQDTAKAITLVATDVDGDALIYAIATSPTHGALTGAGANWTYTPTTGYAGTDSFTFTASDSTLTSPAATVTMTVVASGGTGGSTTSAGGGSSGGGCGIGGAAGLLVGFSLMLRRRHRRG